MRRDNSLTNSTIAELQAGLIIDAHNLDQHFLNDLGNVGKVVIFKEGDTTPSDSKNVFEETGETGRWHVLGSSIIEGGVTITVPELSDTIEHFIDVPVADVEVGTAYKLAVSGGTSDVSGAEFHVLNVKSAGVLKVRYYNNSGADISAGTVIVNIFEV